MDRSQKERVGSNMLSDRMSALVERAVASVVFVVVFDRQEDESTSVGLGSGFCWQDGPGGTLIVTNRHVVSEDPDSSYTVSFGEKGGSRFSAELVGSHPLADIAVLRSSIAPKPELVTFRQGAIWPGEDVVAVGNPHGYTTSFSKGIVSAVDREDFSAPGSRPVRMIQTDATINSGNSGGPLFGMDGMVVGVNTHSLGLRAPTEVLEIDNDSREASPVISQNGNPLMVLSERGTEGLHFAVPADIAEAAASAIVQADGGEVSVGLLGVDFDEDAARGTNSAMQVASGSFGVELSGDPLPDSPAGRAGLRGGDIVVSIGGVPVDHPADLNAWAIKRSSWEREVPLRFLRDEKMHEVMVRGEERKMRP